MAITYTPTTNFGAKDSLPTNDPDKVIKGSEFTTEFTALQTAFSLAAPAASPTFTGTVTIPTADINGGNIDGTVIGAATPAAGSFTTGSFSGNVSFADNAKAIFGAGSDLEIYHSGTHSYIQDSGTGSLRLVGADIEFLNEDFSDFFAKFANNGAATFYYDGSAKLATTATGIDVTGTVTADGLTVQKSGDIAQFTNGTRSAYFAADSGGFSLFTGAGQTGNGLYASEAGTYAAIYTNSSEKVRIDSNGNTLLQTGGAALQWQNGYQTITGDAASNNLTYRTYANHIWKTTTGASSTTDGTERMRIDSSGNVGIGTSSPATPLDVTTAGGGNFVATFQNTTAATPYGVSIKEPASAANGYPSFQITDSTGTNVRLRVDSGTGNVGIGTSSPSAKLGVNATAPDFTFLQSDVVKFRSGVSGTTNGGVTGSASGDYFARTSGGKMLFSTNDGVTAHAVIDSSGNVGIGTTVARELFHLNRSNSEAAGIKFTNSTTGTGASDGSFVGIGSGEELFVYQYEALPVVFATSNTERMRIDSSGRLLVGTASNYGGEALQIDANSVGATVYTAYISNTNTSTSAYNVMRWAQGAAGSATGMIGTGGSAASNAAFRNSFVVGTQSSSPLVFATADAERARIDSSGNLLVGTTSAFTDGSINSGGSGALHIARDNERCLFLKRASSNGAIVEFFRGSISSPVGSISIDASSTTYNTSSDARLKENIADAEDASELIDAIQVRSFDWKADGSHQRYGMVAQELLEVAPEAVSQPEDPEAMMGVDYSKLVPMLVKEIQSLRARVAQLEGA